jgi:hypothetical protein
MGSAVLVLAMLLCALGALLALSALTGSSDPAAVPAPATQPAGGFALGDVVPTSFGVVSADNVRQTAGPTAKALTGVTHGISRLVTPERALVQVTVTVTNLRRTRTLAYSPLQFTLSSGTARPIRPVGGSITKGVLQPSASIQGRISFVVPRSGRHLRLHFRDPARRTPLTIDLGRISKAPPGAAASGHSHIGTKP